MNTKEIQEQLNIILLEVSEEVQEREHVYTQESLEWKGGSRGYEFNEKSDYLCDVKTTLEYAIYNLKEFTKPQKPPKNPTYKRVKDD